MGKVTISLTFDMSQSKHKDVFYDLVSMLHGHLPYVRSIIDPERESGGEKAKVGQKLGKRKSRV